MKAYIIQPSGYVEEQDLSYEGRDNFAKLQAIVEGYVELVSVLYNGKPATLIVNENGITQGQLPNARATAIYWNATQVGRTGLKFDPLGMSMIYGPAILFQVDRREM